MRFQRRETTRPAGTPVCLFVSVPVTDPRPSLHQHTVAYTHTQGEGVCGNLMGTEWSDMHQREYVLHVAASPAESCAAENRPLFLFLRPTFPPRFTNWFPSRLFSAILMLARTLKSDSTLNSGGAQTQTLLSRTNRTSVKFSEKPLNVITWKGSPLGFSN